MAELNYPASGIPTVQGVPDDLHLALKMQALKRKMSLKAYIIEVLQNAVSESITNP